MFRRQLCIFIRTFLFGLSGFAFDAHALVQEYKLAYAPLSPNVIVYRTFNEIFTLTGLNGKPCLLCTNLTHTTRAELLMSAKVCITDGGITD